MVHCVYVVSGDALKSVPIRIAFLLILILYIESWFFKRSYTMSGKETNMFLLFKTAARKRAQKTHH